VNIGSQVTDNNKIDHNVLDYYHIWWPTIYFVSLWPQKESSFYTSIRLVNNYELKIKSQLCAK